MQQERGREGEPGTRDKKGRGRLEKQDKEKGDAAAGPTKP